MSTIDSVKNGVGKAVNLDATDNDPENPLYRIIERCGWPKTPVELAGMEKAKEFAAKDSRNKLLKAVALGIISLLLIVLLAKLP